MKNPFRHRKQIRKHEKHHKMMTKVLKRRGLRNSQVGASGTQHAGKFFH